MTGPHQSSKYTQLLAVIEEIGGSPVTCHLSPVTCHLSPGKDIRPTYAGSKSSAERLKRGENISGEAAGEVA